MTNTVQNLNLQIETDFENPTLIFEIYNFCLKKLYNFDKNFKPLTECHSKDEILTELTSFNSLFQISRLVNISDIDFKNIQILLKKIEAKPKVKSTTDFGPFYEQELNIKTLKKSGIFYTPKKLCTFMLQRCLKEINFKNFNTLKILDPSCGAGIFLINILKEFDNRNYDLHFALENIITGVDIDNKALELCKIALYIEYINSTKKDLNIKLPKLRLFNGDFLLEKEDQVSSFFPEKIKNQKFDLVIGNPPYGLKRNEQLTSEVNQIIKRKYAYALKGKVNKYMVFMAKAYSLIKDEGCLSFVVPNSWLGIKSAEKIRDIFFRDRSLLEISHFNFSVFKDPSVEVVTFIAKKKVKNINIVAVKDSHYSSTASSTLEFEDWGKIPALLIPKTWNKDISHILKKIDSVSYPIKDTKSDFQSLIALQAYAKGKGIPPQTVEQVKNHVFHSDKKLDSSYYPYFDGKTISSYKINWKGRYLKYGDCLAEPQKLERFKGPRILIREIIKQKPYLLHAAYTEDTALYNKSILHIIPKTNSNVSSMTFLSLLAILNSKIASFIIHFRGRKSQRKLFRKIVNDDLKDFPIPLELKKYEESLSELAKMAMNLKTPALLEKIDFLTARAYSLDENQFKLINEYLK